MEYLLIMQNEAGGRKKAQSGFAIVTGAWMRGGGTDLFFALPEKRRREVCLDLSQRIGIYQHTMIVCLLPLGTRFN
jgi:hypothetical protein